MTEEEKKKEVWKVFETIIRMHKRGILEVALQKQEEEEKEEIK